MATDSYFQATTAAASFSKSIFSGREIFETGYPVMVLSRGTTRPSSSRAGFHFSFGDVMESLWINHTLSRTPLSRQARKEKHKFKALRSRNREVR